MEIIKQELAGYRMPAYIEEILSCNYCRGFVRMGMIRQNDRYKFNYKPGIYRNLNYKGMSMYEKVLLIRTLIALCENNREYLIDPECYLIEPELIFIKNGKVSNDSVRIMFYPDIKNLDFIYKVVLFADRILDSKNSEEKELTEKINYAAESGDMNRIKLLLDKMVIRIENRMSEGRIIS